MRASDADLARCIRAGDRTALEAAYLRYAEQVRRAFGWRRRREPEEVDDAVAMSFALLPRMLERAELGEGFDLARHVFLAARQRYWGDFHAKARERATLFRSPTEEARALERLVDDAPTPEEEADTASRARALEDLVGHLSPRLREFLLGREVEGLGDRGLAERFGVSPAYARTAVGRARAALLEAARGTPLEPWLAPREPTGANAGRSLVSEEVRSLLADGEWHCKAELSKRASDVKAALRRLRDCGGVVEKRRRSGSRVGIEPGEWWEYRLAVAPKSV